MCVLITAIHYSNKSVTQPLTGYKFRDRDACKRQSRILIMLICGSKAPGVCAWWKLLGGWGAGLHPRLGSELLPLNTKAGHVTVTYQQWQESSCLGFLRPCFSEPSLFYN